LVKTTFFFFDLAFVTMNPSSPSFLIFPGTLDGYHVPRPNAITGGTSGGREVCNQVDPLTLARLEHLEKIR
jgi:hypothetical protein